MKQRTRIYYTESQKAVMWEHWKKGESLQHLSDGLFNGRLSTHSGQSGY